MFELVGGGLLSMALPHLVSQRISDLINQWITRVFLNQPLDSAGSAKNFCKGSKNDPPPKEVWCKKNYLLVICPVRFRIYKNLKPKNFTTNLYNCIYREMQFFCFMSLKCSIFLSHSPSLTHAHTHFHHCPFYSLFSHSDIHSSISHCIHRFFKKRLNGRWSMKIWWRIFVRVMLSSWLTSGETHVPSYHQTI